MIRNSRASPYSNEFFTQETQFISHIIYSNKSVCARVNITLLYLTNIPPLRLLRDTQLTGQVLKITSFYSKTRFIGYIIYPNEEFVQEPLYLTAHKSMKPYHSINTVYRSHNWRIIAQVRTYLTRYETHEQVNESLTLNKTWSHNWTDERVAQKRTFLARDNNPRASQRNLITQITRYVGRIMDERVRTRALLPSNTIKCLIERAFINIIRRFFQ